MTTLAVQLVNYNTRDHLEPALSAVLADLDGAPFAATVGVLDNASDDDLGDLEAAFAGRVTFARSATNGGFGAGHNQLAANADATLLCIVNPDVTLPEPRTLERLVRWFDDASVVAAGPRLVTTDGATQRWDHGERRGLLAWVANGAGHAYWRERRAPADVAWASGAFLLVRRQAFAAIGGFDERFFLYKEEEDLCLRLRAAGGRVVYDPTVAVGHVGSVVADRQRQMAASVAYFAEKHLPPRRRRVLGWLHAHVTRRLERWGAR